MTFILVVLLSVLALGTSDAIADVLTFSGNACAASSDPGGTGALVACSDNLFINQAFGDTVAVPAVNVTYRDVVQGRSLMFETATFNLPGVAVGREKSNPNAPNTTTSLARVEIAPAGPNEIITLNSFDLGRANSRVDKTNLRILDLNGAVLLDYLVQTIPHLGAAAHFTPGVSSSTGIAIEWSGINTGNTLTDTSAEIIGIDSIAFTARTSPSAEVPEPVTLLLLGTGLACCTVIRRRSR